MVAQTRRGAGVAHGPAQGAPDQEDVPGAGRRAASRAAVGRIEAPIGRDPKHRTRMAVVPDGRPSVTGYRVRERFDGLDAPRARPRHRADAPDPGPSRRDRASRRGRPGLRHRHVAARAGRPRPAVPARLAARADVAVGRHLIRATAPLPAELESVLDGLRAGRPGGDATLGRPTTADRARTAGRGTTPGQDDSTARRGRCSSSSRDRAASARTPSSTRSAATAARPASYHYVVTCTTRAPRPGEVDGVELPLHRPRRVRGAARRAASCLEANEVHGHWYGTPRDRGPRGARRGPGRHPEDRRPGRPASRSRSRRRS